MNAQVNSKSVFLFHKEADDINFEVLVGRQL